MSEITTDTLAEALEALRARGPLVQCLTNVVVTGWTANVLLAVGAAPAMVDNPAEAGVFATVADAVLVNLGTPYAETVASMRVAVEAARAAGTPWVLDPVAVGGLPWRTEVARELLECGPTVVRGNASEIGALSGGSGGRGVEAVDTPESVIDAAGSLASKLGTTIAVSGQVDHLTDGGRLLRITNGHPWLTRVTGSGCALGALTAAFAALSPTPLVAAAAATAVLTVAADVAAERTTGPGSFAVALLDELCDLTPGQLAARTRLD